MTMTFTEALTADNEALKVEYVGKKIQTYKGLATITEVRRSEPDGYGGWLVDMWATLDDTGMGWSNHNVPINLLEEQVDMSGEG